MLSSFLFGKKYIKKKYKFIVLEKILSDNVWICHLELLLSNSYFFLFPFFFFNFLFSTRIGNLNLQLVNHQLHIFWRKLLVLKKVHLNQVYFYWPYYHIFSYCTVRKHIIDLIFIIFLWKLFDIWLIIHFINSSLVFIFIFLRKPICWP